MSAFCSVTTDRFLPDHWTDLLRGRIGLLRLPEFVSAERRAAALAGLTDARFAVYNPMEEFGGTDLLSQSQIESDYRAGGTPGALPISRRLGRTLYEHVARGTAREYFERAEEMEALRRAAFASAGDVVDDVLDLVPRVAGRQASIAEEEGYGRCYAGVIREVHGLSRLHSDDSREETPEFAVGRVPYQLGVNVFLDMPTEGGALIVYEREYRPQDRAYRQGYGLEPRAVTGDRLVGVAPRPGDLILFPARHIHRVDACSGPGRRIMLQAYLGIAKTGDVVCWS